MDSFNYLVANAKTKSYTGTAFMVFVLYLFFFFPGFFMNHMFLQEAKNMERIAGTSLPGVILLKIMFYIASLILIISTCIVTVITAYVLSAFFWR